MTSNEWAKLDGAALRDLADEELAKTDGKNVATILARGFAALVYELRAIHADTGTTTEAD